MYLKGHQSELIPPFSPFLFHLPSPKSSSLYNPSLLNLSLLNSSPFINKYIKHIVGDETSHRSTPTPTASTELSESNPTKMRKAVRSMRGGSISRDQEIQAERHREAVEDDYRRALGLPHLQIARPSTFHDHLGRNPGEYSAQSSIDSEHYGYHERFAQVTGKHHPGVSQRVEPPLTGSSTGRYSQTSLAGASASPTVPSLLRQHVEASSGGNGASGSSSSGIARRPREAIPVQAAATAHVPSPPISPAELRFRNARMQEMSGQLRREAQSQGEQALGRSKWHKPAWLQKVKNFLRKH